MPTGFATAGALGNAPGAVGPVNTAVPDCDIASEGGAGRNSYARRLMFKRWRGEMLSDVMLPPHPPHPSVIAGSSPVVRPIEPCVVGVFTQIRNAGLRSPNWRITSSLREWTDIVCPIPPYRRIWIQRSHPSRQSLTTYQDRIGASFSIDSG